MSEERGLATTSTPNPALLPTVSTQFNLTLKNANELIRRYGAEAVQTALKLKEDGHTVNIGYFLQLQQKYKLQLETMVEIYETRTTINELLPQGYKNFLGAGTIKGMAELCQQFEDYRDNDTDYKVEKTQEVLRIFQKVTFRLLVEKVVQTARERNFASMDEMLEVMSEYSSGDVFRTFFPDGSLGEIQEIDDENW